MKNLASWLVFIRLNDDLPQLLRRVQHHRLLPFLAILFIKNEKYKTFYYYYYRYNRVPREDPSGRTLVISAADLQRIKNSATVISEQERKAAADRLKEEKERAMVITTCMIFSLVSQKTPLVSGAPCIPLASPLFRPMGSTLLEDPTTFCKGGKYFITCLHKPDAVIIHLRFPIVKIHKMRWRTEFSHGSC